MGEKRLDAPRARSIAANMVSASTAMPKGKVSDFGLQLRAKQKLKGHYGDVTEKQFKQTFQHTSLRMKALA
jgi:ribosomal protein S4